MFQQFIIPAISLGVSATTVPGPLTAYIINTTLTQGWRKALLIVFSPILTDAPIIVLMTFILGQMPPEMLRIIQFVGGLLLYYIAYGAWKQYRQQQALTADTVDDKSVAGQSWKRILGTGVMMNYLSPGPYLFWATVNGPLLVSALEVSVAHTVAFLVAFYGTFMIGLCSWVFLFHFVRQVHVRYLKLIILFTILLLLWFGTSLILSAITG